MIGLINNNHDNNSTVKIWVDIDVYNGCQIRAFRLDSNATIMTGMLKGNGLRKAEKVVDNYGALNMSGIYGEIEIDESDFVPIDS